jgi:hypothetical protein
VPVKVVGSPNVRECTFSSPCQIASHPPSLLDAALPSKLYQPTLPINHISRQSKLSHVIRNIQSRERACHATGAHHVPALPTPVQQRE